MPTQRKLCRLHAAGIDDRAAQRRVFRSQIDERITLHRVHAAEIDSVGEGDNSSVDRTLEVGDNLQEEDVKPKRCRQIPWSAEASG